MECGESDEVRKKLCMAVKTAMMEAIEQSPGSRVAALKRARDQILKLLDNSKQGSINTDEDRWRRMIAVEVETIFQNQLRNLAGRG